MDFVLDLFVRFFCLDCKTFFLVSGSAPAVNCKCENCGSKNVDNDFKERYSKIIRTHKPKRKRKK